MLKMCEVYVWEVPVRLTHWVNVVCLITLSFTGYYIGHPYIHHIHPFFYGVHLKDQWVMGWMRLIHFSVAYVFVMSFLLRVYWGFAGNRYARWEAMIPHSKERLRTFWKDLRFYLLLDPAPAAVIGHSATAGLAYVVLYLGYLISILTGFALLSQSHVGWFWKVAGGWIIPFISIQTIRLLHHVMMWFLIVFPIVHLYVGWITDLAEENCVMSSIFSGRKNCCRD